MSNAARFTDQSALEASEAQYRRLFEAAKDGILILDADSGRIHDVNPFLVALTGFSHEEFLGKHLWEIGPFVDMAASKESFADLKAKEYVRYDHLPLQTRDGRTVDVEFVSNVYRVGDAEVIQCNIRDVTESKRAAEELRAAKDFLDNVINAIADPVFVKDDTRRFVLVNDALCELVGRPREALLGEHGDDLFPAEQVAVFRKLDAQVLETGEENVNEESLSNLATGARCTIVTRKTRYVDPAGRPFLVGVIRDITERMQLQAQIAQSDRLASMGMLAAGVAHEINNPLSYVLHSVDTLAQDLPRLASAVLRCAAALHDRVGDAAFAELIGDGAELLGPAALEDIVARARQALEGTQRIRVVSRGLGTFSRVEGLERSRVDLRYAIECAVTMAYNEIRFRARLVKDLAPVPAVWASEGKLSQVFLNLLINACHAIDEGDVEHNRIAIRTWEEEGAVLAEVADSGKGIAPENLLHLFEPFFTTKGPGKGSGLGLAICRNIVTELGGTISVESELGHGTRFEVRLPARAESAEQRHHGVAVDTPAPSAVRGRLLVVDDEANIRGALKRLLGRDHEVVTAASGAEALALLAQDPAFDVILCDLMMPEVSGMDLHAWLATHDLDLSRRVVFVTGGAFTPRASEYLARAGNRKIEKPFDSANLKQLVSQWVVAARSED